MFRLHAENLKSYKSIFLFLSLYDRAYIFLICTENLKVTQQQMWQLEAC